MDPGKRKLYFILATILVFTGGFFVFQKPVLGAAGINGQVNFQGKLVNTDGTNISNGTYNMEFKIYQDGDGVPGGGDETLKWTEDRLRNNSQGVVVTDGIFQANLGSVTAFSGIDWNQSVLWVSINVGNTNATCTPFSNCVPDGEMNPMVRFTAAPYALNADNLDGKDWATPAAIGTGTAAAGTFTNLITNTGGVSIAAGQAYGGAGAVTLSSTTNGLTLDSGNNILTIAATDTALTASGVTTLTLAANTTITNASGNISLQAAGTGTANVQIGDGGAASATPDLLVLDIGSAEPTGTVGAMYYSTALTKLRCYEGAAWKDCDTTGGGGTLQTAYDATSGNTITTTTGRNIAFTFADLAADQSLTLTQQGTVAALILDDSNGATNTAIDIRSGTVSKLTINELGAISTSGTITATGTGTITSAGLLTGTSGVSIGAGQSYTGAGAVTLSSATGANALTLDSTTTGSILIGTNVNAKTITIGNGVDDTFSINSSGLVVTSGGALTGVASIDTIGTTATAITFAGAGTLASTTNGLTLNSGNNILTIDSSDTSLTASGVTTLTLAANTTITNASGNISLQAAGTGTANVQIGDGGAASATPDLLVLDIGSAEPTGTVGAMYYSTALTKFRCYQGAAWADCIGTGGGHTQNTDTGTTQNLFTLGSGTDAADNDITLQFGGSNSETFYFDGNGTDNFLLSDDLIVNGDLTAQGGEVYITGVTSSASTTEGTIYYDNDDDNLYVYAGGGWVDLTIQGGAGPFTDGTDITYLTDMINEDFAVGSDNLVAPFSVDEENNTVRIGEGAGTNGKINMYASDGDTGSITYNTSDSWAFEGGQVAIGASGISGSASSERLLQVGSETNRGNLVTYGEVVTKGMRDSTGLTNIKDVYVYDTSADSDGGRWIDWATTEKLSWYTEALNDGPSDPCVIATDTRCYAQAFPRKAILVVTSDSLYIFDAATNVMWMKFRQNDAGWALGKSTSNSPSSVTALNGVIYVGTKGSAGVDGFKGTNGLYAFDFTQDRMWYYDDSDRSGSDVGIGSRNGVVNYNYDNNTAFDLAVSGTAIDWKNINDVSAAVVQFSASAISATSIPANGITLVALATKSGLTVINMSHQKVLQYSRTTDDVYNAVFITRTAKLYGLNKALGQLELWGAVDIDQVSKLNSAALTKFWDEAAAPGLSKLAPTILDDAPDALEIVERGSLADGGVLATAAAASSSDLIYVGTNQGLTEIHDHQTPTMGWVKYYNTTRQTAIMPATIKRYLPMDEASGDLNDASITGAASANNRTMMPMGSPTFGVNGVRGKGMTFNGTSSYLCSDNNTAGCAPDTIDNMSTTAWTITMWFKHSTSISGFDMLYNRCYTTAPAQATACAAMFMTSTGVMNAVVDTDATWTNGTANSYGQYATTTQTYNDNQWHFATLQRTNASGILFSIDGKAITLAGTAPTLTLEGTTAAITAIGADCSVGVACATGANWWDGSIDEFTFSQSTTTIAGLTAMQMRRLYNDARPVVNKKVYDGAADSVTYTSTAITDSSTPGWIPNEFAGQIVQITSGSGSGQTRRVTSNTINVINVSPALSTTPASNDDFKINPEALFGATNSVTAIGVTGETALGEARMMCAGTNNGTDGGGVTCYNHQAGPNVVADVYHGDSEQFDDYNAEWTGADFDDIQSIDLSGRVMVFGSMAHFWTETQDVRLGQGLDYMSNKIFDLTNAVKNLGMQALAGSSSQEVGLTGGADLAEYYKSPEPLEAGMIVATGDGGADTVEKTNGKYQKDVLGIVSTAPGMILGTQEENSYPIALSGRVPVKMTTENGMISKGDQVTSSSLPGYGMVAIETGRVIGTVLEEVDQSGWADCLVDAGLPIGTKCGEVMVFVNLTDFTGMTMADLMQKKNYDAMTQNPEFANLFSALAAQDVSGENQGENTVIKSEWTNIFQAANTLEFLKKMNDPAEGAALNSEILAKNINVSGQVVSPLIVTDMLVAKNIKVESIEGLEFIQTGLSDTQAGVAENAGQVKSLGQEIADLKNAFQSLSTQSGGLEIDSLKDFETKGSLTFGGPVEFQGSSIFKSVAEFFGKTIFRNSVEFAGTATFNRDTAGYAVIKEGQENVEISFDKAYAQIPVVNASLSLQQIKNEELRKATEELLLVSDIKFIITNATEKGFEIRINQKAASDIPFSWNAVSVKDARIFGEEKNENAGEKREEKPLVIDRTGGSDQDSNISENLAPNENTDENTNENANGLNEQVVSTVSAAAEIPGDLSETQ